MAKHLLVLLWTNQLAKNPGAAAVVQAQLWYRDPFNTANNQATSLSDSIEFVEGPELAPNVQSHSQDKENHDFPPVPRRSTWLDHPQCAAAGYRGGLRTADDGARQRRLLGNQANSHSTSVSVSADGRYVAFQSSASNLAPGDVNGGEDIFVHDRQTGLTELVSVSTSGAQANDESAIQRSRPTVATWHSRASLPTSGVSRTAPPPTSTSATARPVLRADQ